MGLTSLRGYARHRGISEGSVRLAIKDGRLKQALFDAGGKTRVDTDIADKEWPPSLNEVTAKARRAAGYVNPIQEVKKEPIIKPEVSPPVPIQDPDPIIEEDEEEESNGVPDYYKARARKEEANAKLAELKALTEAGKLVEVEIIKKEWTNLASIVRTKVLGIPSKARQRLPVLSTEDYLILESIVRESLEELSDVSY